ncbi:ribbon-helix-helix domain-containing protein [Corallococcus sp. EGB]|uniref:ribbon-helix-helix domain-containing protein n=1 Tax=Corallococcus sp. EGB TaxID=1521117 RepID=UPI001CBD554E|nr:ribbon-helix-helix domain-containing protein [Corallococcus sp. EGB]
MSTKTKAKTKRTKKNDLEGLRLPELWERFKEATGESTKSPNRKFLIRRIEEALAARTEEPPAPSADEALPPARRNARSAEPTPETSVEGSAAPKQRGRFASITIQELQAKYLEVVGRSTGSDDRRYLIWKIREAEKGRINVGPRKTRARDGEPLDVKILPLRLEADVADKMDEAWRSRGIKNRMEFFRGAIGHYLAHLGARDAAALFANAGATGS